MKLLLDTHVLLWALQGSEKLPVEIREEILDERNEIYVSVASLWEISIKHKKKPEIMPFSAEDIKFYSQRAGYFFLSISVDAISVFDKNDLSFNNDPFDKILISQSEAHNLRLITHDEKIKESKIGYVEFF